MDRGGSRSYDNERSSRQSRNERADDSRRNRSNDEEDKHQTGSREDDRHNGRSRDDSRRQSRNRDGDRHHSSDRDDARRQSSNNEDDRRHGRDNDDGRKSNKNNEDDDRRSRKNNEDGKRSRSRDGSPKTGRKSAMDDADLGRVSKRSSRITDSRQDQSDSRGREARDSYKSGDKKDIDSSYKEKMAELVCNSDCFSDALDFLTEYATERKELTDKEMDLLWTSFRGHVAFYRRAWRNVTDFSCGIDKHDKQFLSAVLDYKNKLNLLVIKSCEKNLKLLETVLLPNVRKQTSTRELHREKAIVFYLKMVGDCHRYIWEMEGDKAVGSDRPSRHDGSSVRDKQSAADAARKAYEEAIVVAKEHMDVCEPLRLGLFLNHSVLLYEVLGCKEDGVILTKDTVSEANHALKKVNHKVKDDAEAIIASMEINLDMWKTEGH